MKIVSIVGTRPNFMKIAPFVKEISKRDVEHVLVHTGQHYDEAMSKLFFDDLQIPKPDINLEVGSASYGEQTGAIMQKLEEVFEKEKPDVVVVVGDVNSTLAAALIAKQMKIPVAHIESGLRSFDLTMPEEINRIITDRLSDYLFITEASGHKNLKTEGISVDKIHFVGNVMIDTLLHHVDKAKSSKILEKIEVKEKEYIAATIHRPSNVDSKEALQNILAIFHDVQYPIIFPVHPRTRKNLEKFGLMADLEKMNYVKLIDPVGYLDFLHLTANAKLVMTDSGGIQEETTVLGVPCITLRKNTERPVTQTEGTNMLVDTDKEAVVAMAKDVLSGKVTRKVSTPEMWDGKAAERIVDILLKQ